MDIEKMIEQLNGYFEGKDLKRCVALDSATALSTLQAENEKLRAELVQIKAERDMAVEDFRRIGSEGLCSVCGNLNAPDLYCSDCKGTAHIVTDMFEWRGPQKKD